MSESMDKYIFDPNNPKQCKSYKLLLRIAQKENSSFFSSEFLQYFFADELLGDTFKNEFWDLPVDYEEMSCFEKIELYKKQLSVSDLHEYGDNIDVAKINTNRIKQYSFFKTLVDYEVKGTNTRSGLIIKGKVKFNKYIVENIFYKDEEYRDETYSDTNKYNRNFILFSIKNFHILNFNIEKSSIIITLEENMEDYLENENENVKPIFLKKIEDIDILLKVLEEDITKQKIGSVKKEIIPTIDIIHIRNFYSMDEIKLDNLKDKKEIYIVGENGDGKSLLLQAITIGLVGVDNGSVFDIMKNQDKSKFTIVDSQNNTYEKSNKPYKNILAYGSNRNNNCNHKNDELGYLTLFNQNYDLIDPVKWLQHLDYNSKANPEDKNLITLDTAREILIDILNKDIDLEVNPDEVIFKEKGSKVDFNRLSAGYKSVITIVCDMIDRFAKKQPYVSNIKEYQGLVLIDEVELHLHPKWKYNFMAKLGKIFPKIQFIVTTHSPTVILGASKEAVFYKIYKEDGIVNISNQIQNKGYTNNSLVSSPLFDLESMTSRGFDNKNLNDNDYISQHIHQLVSKELEKDKNFSDDDIDKLIQKELDAL